MSNYKVKFTRQERMLLVKNNCKKFLEYDGQMVSKKTYDIITSTLNSIKRKEFGATL